MPFSIKWTFHFFRDSVGVRERESERERGGVVVREWGGERGEDVVSE